ncbi:hypothetical protein MNBD_ALPHA09-1371 [hydrothermal vent metagenome]|uniref:Uncharacterized protein n=1 Tax=hydrothermal vent metagenome TaxID=652676 RepID=A0A3B0TA00_9ZZZZ
MVPSQQRLHAGDPIVLQIDLRLIEEFKFVAFAGAPQLSFQGPARLKSDIHHCFKHASAVATGGFCPVERGVGIADRGFGIHGTGLDQRNADADADNDLVPFNIVGFVQGLVELGRERNRPFRIGTPPEQDGKFIAAKPRHHSGVAHQSQGLFGNFLQQKVTITMTERIVDV